MAERIFREERSPAIPQRPQEVACCLGGLNMAQGLTHSLESSETDLYPQKRSHGLDTGSQCIKLECKFISDTPIEG